MQQNFEIVRQQRLQGATKPTKQARIGVTQSTHAKHASFDNATKFEDQMELAQ